MAATLSAQITIIVCLPLSLVYSMVTVKINRFICCNFYFRFSVPYFLPRTDHRRLYKDEKECLTWLAFISKLRHMLPQLERDCDFGAGPLEYIFQLIQITAIGGSSFTPLSLVSSNPTTRFSHSKSTSTIFEHCRFSYFYQELVVPKTDPPLYYVFYLVLRIGIIEIGHS